MRCGGAIGPLGWLVGNVWHVGGGEDCSIWGGGDHNVAHRVNDGGDLGNLGFVRGRSAGGSRYGRLEL